MIDSIKFFSPELRIHVTCQVMLPSDYHKEKTIYKPFYYICERSPFSTNDELIDVINQKNIVFIAIYPTLDIKKNALLFDFLNKEYDFAYIYAKYIIFDLIKKIEPMYRISTNKEDKHIIGDNITSSFTLLAPFIYSNEIGNTIAINLNLDKNFALLKTNLLSYFDPNVNVTISSRNREKALNINTSLKEFGIKKSEVISSSTFKEFIERK